MANFKYEPNRVKKDIERVRYDDEKHFNNLNANGKGSHIMGFNQKKYGEEFNNIDWSK